MVASPYNLPDALGHFGPYGGVFVAETLIPALEELKVAYAEAQRDPQFIAEFEYELKHYVGRPSPVYHAKRLSDQLGGAQIHLKREDLNLLRQCFDGRAQLGHLATACGPEVGFEFADTLLQARDRSRPEPRFRRTKFRENGGGPVGRCAADTGLACEIGDGEAPVGMDGGSFEQSHHGGAQGVFGLLTDGPCHTFGSSR